MTNSSTFSLRKALFLVPAVCLATALTQSAQGASRTFDATSGLWTAGGSWVGGTAAGVGDTALFSQAEDQVAQLDANVSVLGINVSSANARTFQGLTTLRTLTLTGSSLAPSSLAGTLTLDNVTLQKTGSGNLNVSSASTLTLASGGSYVQTQGTISLGANLNFAGTGDVSLSRASGNVLIASTPNVTLNLGSGVNTTISSGTININATGVTLANAGTLNLTGTATFGGTVALTLNNTGTLNVGATTPTMFAGSVLGLTGGNLNLSITGDATGGGLGIASSGTITLGGSTLNVNTVDVTEGSVFTILNAGSGGSVSGTFGDVNITGPQQFSVTYGASSVTLTAVPEPQYYAGAVGLGLLAFTAWRRSRKAA